MTKRIRSILLLTLIPLILISILFMIHRPIRIICPEILGFKRIYSNVYVDEYNRGNEAIILSKRSVQDVESLLGEYHKKPKVVFCSRQESFEKYGFKKSASRTVGLLGIIIGPRAWKEYYIEHELIHYWQFENLGMFKMNKYPKWLIEGMAYYLSNDPREVLEEPWHSYREEFGKWYSEINKNDLKNEIRRILER